MSAPTLRVTRADGSVVTVLGTALEQLPAQTAEGGGVNSTLHVPLERPLNPGETVYFNLVVGYQATGTLRFLVRAEIAH